MVAGITDGIVWCATGRTFAHGVTLVVDKVGAGRLAGVVAGMLVGRRPAEAFGGSGRHPRVQPQMGWLVKSPEASDDHGEP